MCECVCVCLCRYTQHSAGDGDSRQEERRGRGRRGRQRGRRNLEGRKGRHSNNWKKKLEDKEQSRKEEAKNGSDKGVEREMSDVVEEKSECTGCGMAEELMAGGRDDDKTEGDGGLTIREGLMEAIIADAAGQGRRGGGDEGKEGCGQDTERGNVAREDIGGAKGSMVDKGTIVSAGAESTMGLVASCGDGGGEEVTCGGVRGGRKRRGKKLVGRREEKRRKLQLTTTRLQDIPAKRPTLLEKVWDVCVCKYVFNGASQQWIMFACKEQLQPNYLTIPKNLIGFGVCVHVCVRTQYRIRVEVINTNKARGSEIVC